MRQIIGYGGGKDGGGGSAPTESPDSLHSISYAKVLDLVSEGEIVGPVNGLRSVFLDGTPIMNADGSQNFTNVSFLYRTGTQDQDYIPGFPSVDNEIGVGVELTNATPWVHQINNTALSAMSSSMQLTWRRTVVRFSRYWPRPLTVRRRTSTSDRIA
jgi:predicted phage tail protein